MGNPNIDDISLDSIEAEIKKFEQEERRRLGIEDNAADHWNDPVPSTFTASQRASTTVLVCGLTMAHDKFIQAGLSGIGYNVKAMDVPDNEALQFGREFGNRGQCNPTYFTVGNLVKYLTKLHQAGMSKQEIVEKYLFVTAGACGPCRFGTYVTEYRKALRDAGFDGFRVMLFQQQGGLKQATGEGVGLELNPKFFWQVVRAIVIGDVLNAMVYRIRPYEVEKGATDKAMDRCKEIIADAFENNKSVMKAMYRARRELGSVKVDRTRICPKVAIIGEFWAMTTEGDGNYHLQRFLEGEGAEVDIQLVTAWLLYNVWQVRYDTAQRAKLRGYDKTKEEEGSKFSLKGVDVRKRLATLHVAELAIHGIFQTIAKAMGLYDYHLPDMEEMAKVSHVFYDNNLRGGEGHMEVGKLILNVAKSKVNMTLSVKPFGCMPSSSVSDGVQSLITELYPGGIFLPIETNGDGAVNVYSRVQMQLFKAKQHAQAEVDEALEATGLTMDEVKAFLDKHSRIGHAFFHPHHVKGCTTADMIYEVAARKSKLGYLKHRITRPLRERKHNKEVYEHLIESAKKAAESTKRKTEMAKLVTKSEGGEDGQVSVPKGRKQLSVLN